MSDRTHHTGGNFLVQSVGDNTIYCREKFTNEHREIEEMVKEFAKEKIYANRDQLEDYDKDLSLQLIRESGELGLLGVGVPEDGFLTALNTVGGSDFEEFYASVVRSRMEIDYTRYASQAGFRVRTDRQLPTLYMGIQYVEIEGGLARISRVIPDSPAAAAGLDNGDILLAFDDRRLTFSNFQSELRRRKLGEIIDLTITRGNRILVLELRPTENQEEIWTLVNTSNARPEQMEIRHDWIGQPN